jgi:hypothetical protein
LATIIGSHDVWRCFLITWRAATIRAAVNKSLEQGIVTEDLAAREQPLIKQVIEIG